jgi:hypothetical protein
MQHCRSRELILRGTVALARRRTKLPTANFLSMERISGEFHRYLIVDDGPIPLASHWYGRQFRTERKDGRSARCRQHIEDYRRQSGTDPTLMNKAVGDKAASSQDVKKQIEGELTAAQQAQGDC